MHKIILILFILIGSICSQDFDQDGIVDLNDWSTLAAVLGDSTTGLVDITNDGRVDGRDHFSWAVHYGDTLTLSSPNDDSLKININRFHTKVDSIRIELFTSAFGDLGTGSLITKQVTPSAPYDTTIFTGGGTKYITYFAYDSLYTWQGWNKGVSKSISITSGLLVYNVGKYNVGVYGK